MKSVHKILITIIVLSIGFIFTSCRKEDENNLQKVQPVNVKTEILKPSRLVDAIEVAGTVKAFEDVNISPEEGGVIKEWKVKKGHRVKKGDLIVALKDEVIKAGYDAAEAQYKTAELNVEKQQKVFDQQGISELQFKNMEYGRDAAKANADLMKARYERMQLKSPIDGVLDDTFFDEGEFVPPGVSIARIVNLNLVKIQAEVPELYSRFIKRGDWTIVTLDALAGDTVRGVLSFISSTVSSANRALTVEMVVPNYGRRMKPEMVAKVNILRDVRDNALMVNENIVQLVDRDRCVVFVVTNGVAEERQVVLGARQGNKVEIVNGLKANDNIVTTGYQRLVNGQSVVIVK